MLPVLMSTWARCVFEGSEGGRAGTETLTGETSMGYPRATYTAFRSHGIVERLEANHPGPERSGNTVIIQYRPVLDE